MSDNKQTTKQSLYFVDSNIWLYILLPNQDATKMQTAKTLLQQNHDKIVISSQVVGEVVNNLIRKAQLDESSIRTLIDSLYNDYLVVNLDQLIMKKASPLRESYSFSYWDSLIVAAALHIGAVTLYSEDMHNGLIVDKQLTISNPFTP